MNYPNHNILNGAENIAMWNGGNFHHLDTSALRNRLSEKVTDKNHIVLSQKQLAKLENEYDELMDRFRDKYSR